MIIIIIIIIIINPERSMSVDSAIPNSHTTHCTITERLQKYTDLTEELITLQQLKTACIIL